MRIHGSQSLYEQTVILFSHAINIITGRRKCHIGRSKGIGIVGGKEMAFRIEDVARCSRCVVDEDSNIEINLNMTGIIFLPFFQSEALLAATQFRF